MTDSIQYILTKVSVNEHNISTHKNYSLFDINLTNFFTRYLSKSNLEKYQKETERERPFPGGRRICRLAWTELDPILELRGHLGDTDLSFSHCAIREFSWL